MHAPLSHWLTLLWGTRPTLHLSSASTFISGGAIHLPARPHWHGHMAGAAHACAHLVYSPRRFESRGLVPLARALLGLLEDARVEALAVRELPGLARLWRPLHTATPDLGGDPEALMQRLARALIDPSYDDPHPWVHKGRALFYLDVGLGLPALCTPAELRQAASRLGHDLGQMRLPFNAKTHQPSPAYRDDHRWMWDAEPMSEHDARTAVPDPAAGAAAPLERIEARQAVSYPEWDRLIGRTRADWCQVVEHDVPQPPAVPLDADVVRAGRRLHLSIRSLARPTHRLRRSAEGPVFDLDALLDWRIARHVRRPGDPRVYRDVSRRAAQASVWLLIDQSASTASAHSPGGATVLSTAVQSAAAAAMALQSLGVSCAVAGFSSNGRHAVRLHTVKGVRCGSDGEMMARLHALRPAGSTRMGAVIRHATQALSGRGDGPRWVVVLSDGQPFDVDVHDPRYLVEDARHAVREASRRAVRTACLVVAADPSAQARRIFGERGVQVLQGLQDLPRAMQRLLA